MRISDWSSDVCSSDLDFEFENTRLTSAAMVASGAGAVRAIEGMHDRGARAAVAESLGILRRMFELTTEYTNSRVQFGRPLTGNQVVRHRRSKEHPSELQPLMRTPYAVSCLKKKKNKHT